MLPVSVVFCVGFVDVFDFDRISIFSCKFAPLFGLDYVVLADDGILAFESLPLLLYATFIAAANYYSFFYFAIVAFLS